MDGSQTYQGRTQGTSRARWFLLPVLAIGIGLAAVIVVALVRSEDQSTVGPGEYTLDYQCELSDGLMTAVGTIGNNLDHSLDVRLDLAAVSGADADPPIFRSYDLSLEPDETREFQYPIINADSLSVRVDDDYICTATVESP